MRDRFSQLPSIRRGAVALAVFLAAMGIGVAAEATPYTYAGFTFEQDDTPDQLATLGNGDNLGGAQFSSGQASSLTQSVAFVASNVGGGGVITPQAGFDPALSLGRQAYDQLGITEPDGSSCHYACAVNLPSGNNGAANRHGLSASWSGGNLLFDGSGDDFVIYESATGTSTEGYMIRLELADGSFSGWRYEFADGSEFYLDDSNSAVATAFDLALFGADVVNGVSAIQIANLMPNDRVGGADGEGFVSFDGTGNTVRVTSNGSTYGNSALDPDPLYIGILSTVRAPGAQDVPEPATLALFGAGLLGLGLARRRKG